MTAYQRAKRRSSWKGAALAILGYCAFFAALGAVDVIQKLTLPF